MEFNSLEYIAFLGLVLALYYGVSRTEHAQKVLIVLASALFYAFWSAAFLLHFFAVVALNYWASMLMERAQTQRAKRAILCTAIVLNLGNLGLWKYAGLTVDTLNMGLALSGLTEVQFARPTLVLPLAISFYTFHVISYLVDLYRHQADAKPKSLLDFLFYVTLFPHQIAGPILRGHELFPQIGYKRLATGDLVEGMQRVLLGLFQKAVIADNLSIVVDHGFRNYAELSAGEIYVVLLAYSFQIYFDFCGYTNMGIGSARMLGYRLPENFNMPYLAVNISDFWRRWHMTLSRWIRDYIFIPLGGSRGTEAAIARSLLITMGLAGLWHGASWSFALWGLVHGGGLVVHRWWMRLKASRGHVGWVPVWLRRVLAVTVTFHFVTLAWVLFRAPDLTTALGIYGRLLDGVAGTASWTVDQAYFFKTYGFTAMVLYGLFYAGVRWGKALELGNRSIELRVLCWCATVYLTLLLAPLKTDPFIYFQF
jgi:alginate O-acetyltransferase complex protein AlgI